MSALPAESYPLATLLAAWEESLHAVVELGRRLSAQQWEAPTECPGWSAGDIVRHLSWIEAFLAGRPDPEHEVDWSRMGHVTSDFGRVTETGVDVRRSLEQQQVCDELAQLVDVRLAQLGAVDPFELDTRVMGVFGQPVAIQSLLRVRVLDTWTHEQDIRRAAAVPGNLATAPAQVAAVQLSAALPFVLARNLAAPVATTMRVTVEGPVAFERWSVVDDDGRGQLVDELARVGPDADASVGLTTDWETFARLAAGRLDVTDPRVLARCSLSGVPDLAARLPEALAITP